MHEGYVFIHDHIFPTLLAVSNQEQQRGLMYVEPPTPVMTFVYGSPGINKFWMLNTKSPLDILFCHQGKVSDICYGEPHSTRMIGSNLFSDLVIELPYGTSESANIKIGHAVGLVSPTPEEVRKIIAQHSGGNFR
jgi:uncharacterized membrane protein (UPF0127 family)